MKPSDADRLRDVLDAFALINKYAPANREAFDNDEPIRSQRAYVTFESDDPRNREAPGASAGS